MDARLHIEFLDEATSAWNLDNLCKMEEHDPVDLMPGLDRLIDEVHTYLTFIDIAREAA